MSVVGRVQINRPGATGVIPPSPIDDSPVDPGDYLGVIMADGATAAWPLDENDETAVYADAIGSLDATLIRSTTSAFAGDPIGPSSTASAHYVGAGTLSAEPADIAITTGLSEVLDVGTNDFTMEWWAVLEVPVGTASLLMPMGVVADTMTGFAISAVAGPAAVGIEGTVQMQDGNNLSAMSSERYDDQVLHHGVFTRRGGSYFVIMDGVEVATATPDEPFDLDGWRIHLGGIEYYPLAGYTAYSMCGSLAWCAWYPVGLTAEVAMSHFVAGGGG